MERLDYRTLYNQIKDCIEQWKDSDSSDFDYKPYLWVTVLEGEMEVAICETDEPNENEMYDFSSFFDDYVDADTGVIETIFLTDKIHEIVRKWCWTPTAAESNNYEIPEIVTEANLMEFCSRFREAIALGDKRYTPCINVRYAVNDMMFHVAEFGDYFFFEQKMYVFDKRPIWEPYHDAFAVMATFGNPCRSRGYAHAVAFCGVQTPFKDDQGADIFTGDICQVKELSGEYHVVTANEFEGYGFKLDNHMLQLEQTRKPLHRVGTIFYGLSLKEPLQNTWLKSSDISTMYGQVPDIEEKLGIAKLTPSFGKMTVMTYIVLSVCTEESDWRIIFDASNAYPDWKLEPRRISPKKIVRLNSNHVFVFGSNYVGGQHRGKAARFALQKFGAEFGVSEGPTGQCYALPTCEGEEALKRAVHTFTRYARQHPELTFLVTAVGCGNTGFTAAQVAPWFAEAAQLENVYLPLAFLNVLGL